MFPIRQQDHRGISKGPWSFYSLLLWREVSSTHKETGQPHQQPGCVYYSKEASKLNREAIYSSLFYRPSHDGEKNRICQNLLFQQDSHFIKRNSAKQLCTYQTSITQEILKVTQWIGFYQLTLLQHGCSWNCQVYHSVMPHYTEQSTFCSRWI